MRIPCGVALLSLMTATAVAQQTDKPVVQNTSPSQFQKNPGLPDCLTLAVERGDPSNGPSILLVKGTRGCSAPWHFHSPNEQLMMVSGDRKSTRLNSSHRCISYAVFCLKKKRKKTERVTSAI